VDEEQVWGGLRPWNIGEITRFILTWAPSPGLR
jgi:hypothetical protein